MGGKQRTREIVEYQTIGVSHYIKGTAKTCHNNDNITWKTTTKKTTTLEQSLLYDGSLSLCKIFLFINLMHTFIPRESYLWKISIIIQVCV